MLLTARAMFVSHKKKWKRFFNQRRRRGRANTQPGFTLLEVLVALAILSVSLAALLLSLSASLHHELRARREAEAAQVAQSLLSSLGDDIPLQAGTVDGDEGPTYHWRLTIAAYDNRTTTDSAESAIPATDSASSATPGAENSAPRAFDVSATVSWGGGTAENAVTLRTLKIVPASLVR